MKRRLINILTALSLVLCIASCAMWLRSHRVQDELERVRPINVGDIPILESFIGDITDQANARTYSIEFSRGRIYIFVGYCRVESPNLFGWKRHRSDMTDDPTIEAAEGGFCGLAFESRGDAYYTATIPIWMLVCFFGVLPALWLQGAVRKIRRRNGACPSCGYDLRATPQRCPECGMVQNEASHPVHRC